MFNYSEAKKLVEDTIRRNEEVNENNYHHLFEVVDNPSLLPFFNGYEEYVDGRIREACEKGNRVVAVSSFSSQYIKELLAFYDGHKTSYLTNSSFCELLNNWFDAHFFTRYEEDGYIVRRRDKCVYEIKWF